MRQNSILLSKINRLIELIDESTDLFFEERQWLENPCCKEIEINYQDERRKEIQLKIKKTSESASKEFRKVFPEKVYEYEQSGISGVVE